MPAPPASNVGANIKHYMEKGRPQKQAIAIAMSRRRQAGGGNSNSNPNLRTSNLRSTVVRNVLDQRRASIVGKPRVPRPPKRTMGTLPSSKVQMMQRAQTSKRPFSLPDFRSMSSDDLNSLKTMLSQRHKPASKKEKVTGPRPSARAYERANVNARFKRGQTSQAPVDTRREAIKRRILARRKKKQGLRKTNIPTYPRGTQS